MEYSNEKNIGVIISIMILCTAGYVIQRNNRAHEDIEVIHMEVDRVVYHNLTELMNASDLVVIGEYCQDTEQLIEYSFSNEFNKNVITDMISTISYR